MVFAMNANKLTEIIEHLENAMYIGASKAAEMLRQKQAEIDKLKNLLLDNQILLDKTLNAWAKEMERKK